jgi:dTDP-4-amino-4,6-dideoxygalactose transaminase
MPSFTFVSTANAFALRGMVPVFIDIRPDTLNMDENLLEQALSTKTRAIAPVHYAGVFCEMDAINAVANHKRILVVEDAAQAFDSTYKGKKVGQLSKLSCLSFHETKNVIAGEGGALLINDPELAERAEILREKGTNRRQFLRGQVDKYSWVDLGSSFLPSELNAAVLKAQLERKDWILSERMKIWNQYHQGLKQFESEGRLTRPVVPEGITHNAHMYYVILPSAKARDLVLKDLNQNGVQATFHYVPLHETSPAKKMGRTAGSMKNTVELSARLLRLPLWIGVEPHLPEIIEKLGLALKKI